MEWGLFQSKNKQKNSPNLFVIHQKIKKGSYIVEDAMLIGSSPTGASIAIPRALLPSEMMG